ncbi:MAG: hypothetical protein M3P49_08850 [Actinomycetota bacterium]|nr:hypothetical protein [Actinomycetota bacterium]
MINLGKVVPLVGGIIGGPFDATTTYAIERVVRAVFVTGRGSRSFPLNMTLA